MWVVVVAFKEMRPDGFCLWVFETNTSARIFFARSRRHTSWNCDWSSDVCSSDLLLVDSKSASLRTIRRTALQEVRWEADVYRYRRTPAAYAKEVLRVDWWRKDRKSVV